MTLRVPSLLLLVHTLPCTLSAAQQPPLVPSSDFTVTANGVESFVYLATVPGALGNGLTNASFVHVTLPAKGGAASVRIVVKNRSAPIASAGLRPRGSPEVHVDGAAGLSLEISNAGHYILELDGSFNATTLNTGLMIFVDAEELSPPSAADDSVVYFGAGVHEVPGGLIVPGSDTTVYLAVGAVVLAKIAATEVHNVTVRGPGILAAEWLPGTAAPYACHHCGCPGDHGIAFVNSSDVTVEGITLMHVTSWMLVLESVVGARVSGIRELGWRCNNDGIDIVSSQDVLVEGCFIRSADDAIAVKGMVPTMATRGVLVRDTLMFPHGNCMEVGFELFNDFVENVTFERNTCLHQMMSAMSVHDGGHAHVRGLSYRDIVIEGLVAPPKTVAHDLSYGYKLLDLQIIQSHYSGPDMDKRGAISEVTYSNIT